MFEKFKRQLFSFKFEIYHFFYQSFILKVIKVQYYVMYELALGVLPVDNSVLCILA